MSRQYPLPNDLIDAGLLQEVTDGSVKRFPTVAERIAAYHQPVTDLSRPETERPPRKGEPSVISGGNWTGVALFNGQTWERLSPVAYVSPTTLEIYDVGVRADSLPGNANFLVVLRNPPPVKVVVHWMTEDYNPVPVALRGTGQINLETASSKQTSPTAEIVGGTDFPYLVGSLVYDPDDDNDDFVITTDGLAPVAVISVPVEDTAAAGNRFQVRLFDPVNARFASLDGNIGVAVIQGGPNYTLAKLRDVVVQTVAAEPDKPDDPVLIQATTARFPINKTGNPSGSFTWRTQAATAGSGDFTEVTDQAVPDLTSVSFLDVAIPAQLAETDEFFWVIVTPTNDGTDWLRKSALCWLEGNPANSRIIIPEILHIVSNGLDQFIEIPYAVIPASPIPINLHYYFQPNVIGETNLQPGIDYPDIVRDNPASFTIPAARTQGVLRVPFGWFNRLSANQVTTRQSDILIFNIEPSNPLPLISHSTIISVIYDTTATVVRLPVLTAGDSVRSETAATLDFPFVLDRPPPEGTAASVDFATIGLTASPNDYGIPATVPTGVTYNTRPSGEIYGTVSFTASGDDDGTRRTLRLAITRDTLLEADERLRIRLTNPVRCSLTRTEATGVIRNDDLASAVTGVPDFTLSDGQVVGNTMTFQARLSRPASSAVTFDVTTIPGTATAFNDFLPATRRRIVIGAGRLSANINIGLVPPVGDTAAETFLLAADNLSGNARGVRLTARAIIPPV